VVANAATQSPGDRWSLGLWAADGVARIRWTDRAATVDLAAAADRAASEPILMPAAPGVGERVVRPGRLAAQPRDSTLHMF